MITWRFFFWEWSSKENSRKKLSAMILTLRMKKSDYHKLLILKRRRSSISEWKCVTSLNEDDQESWSCEKKKNFEWNYFDRTHLSRHLQVLPNDLKETYPIPDYVRNNQTGLKFHHLLSLDAQYFWTQASSRGNWRKRKFLPWKYKQRYLFTQYTQTR